MSSKLRKALGAVKDQTSISLAKVTNAANLEVTILRATTHDPTPMEDRYVNEILQLVSSNKVYAAACAQAIGKRIGKTRDWVVALKSLMLVLRIFQDGDPYFPREVFHAMKRGARILNLSSFRDDSNSSPWDYTAFVRTFALYLDERLDCFLTGKLQRRFNYHNQIHDKNYKHMMSNEPGIKDMKPIMLLDRISYWQRLLDRAIATRPTGSARTDRLVQISLYAIVRESFDLCRDISDGLTVILDSFFELPYQACVSAFQACVKSSKQFDELSSFYSLCISTGIGRTSEYPNIQKVSDEVIETLQDFLKEQASNTVQSPFPKNVFLPAPRDLGPRSGQDEAFEQYMTPGRSFENVSEYGSQCTSLEDLMSATDVGFSPRASLEQDMYSDESNQDDKQSQDDFSSAYDDAGSTHSLPAASSSVDLVSLDGFQKDQPKNQMKDCWELVLAETATKSNHKASTKLADGGEPFSFDALFDQFSIPQQNHNPFLEDAATTAPSKTNVGNQMDFMDFFYVGPTFQATAPTFCAQNSTDASAPTFRSQNSQDETKAPTFNSAQTSNFEADLALIFGSLNPNDMAMAPTFRAQSSVETNIVPGFKAQKEFNMVPTFSTQESTNTSMAQGFGYQNSDTMPSFKAQKEFNMTPTFSARELTNTNIAQGFQYQSSDMMPSFMALKEFNMAPTYSVQDSTNTYTARGFQSHNLDTTPTFKAPKEFHMAPIFSTQDSSDTNGVWSVQSQNPDTVPSFKTQKEFIMAPRFSAQDSIDNNMAQAFQSHNSNTTPSSEDQKEFNMTPTFNAQESKNSNMTRGFQSQNPDTIPSVKAQKECNMAPIFSARDSTNTNMARRFQSQNPNMVSSFKAQKELMAPTFNVQEPINTNMARDLQSQNPNMMQSFEPEKEFNMAPTFNAHDSTNNNMAQGFQSHYPDTVPSFKAQKEFIITPTFSPQDSTNASVADGFQSQNPYSVPSFKVQEEFNMTPTFNAQNSRNINRARGFHSLDSDVSAFYANSSSENGSTTASHVQSLVRTSTAPAFSSQDFNATITSPSFAAQSYKNSNLGADRSFQIQNFNQTMIAPTFNAKDFDEMTGKNAQNNPFEPWSSGMTKDSTSNHSMQEQNLLQQQQMWMEQQKKIMAKYMT